MNKAQDKLPSVSHGSPLDGIPWWGKAIIIPIYAVGMGISNVVDGIKGCKDSIKQSFCKHEWTGDYCMKCRKWRTK